MKNSMMALMGAAGAAFLAGCTTPCVVSQVGNETEVKAGSMSETSSAKVTVKAADKKSNALASGLKMQLSSGLTGRGIRIAEKGQPSAYDVSVVVSKWEKARLADWRVYEGQADVQVSCLVRGGLVGAKTFNAVGERASNEKDADAGVLRGLSAQANAFLAKHVTALPPSAPAPTGMYEARLSLRLPGPAREREDFEKAECFRESVSAMSGVSDCVLVRQDNALGLFEYQVTYMKSSFPEGLLNAVLMMPMPHDCQLVPAR